MIPLGLKETKEIDFREPFKDFVLEHYSEDGHDYENAIAGERAGERARKGGQPK